MMTTPRVLSSRLKNLSITGYLPCTDRKSTRLNSSHTVISYAVFCLKKKNDEQVVLEYVHERLEQAADAGLVVRRGGDERVGRGELLDRLLQMLAGEAGHRRARDVHG